MKNTSVISGRSSVVRGPLSVVAGPRYALRKGLGVWELTFEGRHAVLKHEQGIYYVAYLLTHPPMEPIHGLALATKSLALYDDSPVATTITDPATGKTVVVEKHATIQQRNLALDDAEAAARLRVKQRELEAIVDGDDISEPVKAEVLRDLEAIYAFQKRNEAELVDLAQKAARTVRMGIRRLHQHLVEAVVGNGDPHPVMGAFAAHLEAHLIFPSARFSTPEAHRRNVRRAGCFTYEPPPGVVWAQ